MILLGFRDREIRTPKVQFDHNTKLHSFSNLDCQTFQFGLFWAFSHYLRVRVPNFAHTPYNRAKSSRKGVDWIRVRNFALAKRANKKYKVMGAKCSRIVV